MSVQKLSIKTIRDVTHGLHNRPSCANPSIIAFPLNQIKSFLYPERSYYITVRFQCQQQFIENHSTALLYCLY